MVLRDDGLSEIEQWIPSCKSIQFSSRSQPRPCDLNICLPARFLFTFSQVTLDSTGFHRDLGQGSMATGKPTVDDKTVMSFT